MEIQTDKIKGLRIWIKHNLNSETICLSLTEEEIKQLYNALGNYLIDKTLEENNSSEHIKKHSVPFPKLISITEIYKWLSTVKLNSWDWEIINDNTVLGGIKLSKYFLDKFIQKFDYDKSLN